MQLHVVIKPLAKNCTKWHFKVYHQFTASAQRLWSAADRTCVVPHTHNVFGDSSFAAAMECSGTHSLYLGNPKPYTPRWPHHGAYTMDSGPSTK